MPLDPRAKRLLDMLALRGSGEGRMTAAERRAGFKALMALSRKPLPMREVREAALAGPAGPLGTRLYVPAEGGTAPAPGLVFFHGGGLVAGDLDSHDDLCRSLATAARCRLLAVDYRLAPDHRFPAALEDAVAAARTVAAETGAFGMDPGRLAVGGDSAGGTLATLAALDLAPRLRAAGAPPLRFQLLLCPVLDLAARRPSRLAYGTGYMLDQAIMDRDLADYLPPGVDPADPRVSPIRTPDLSGQPPTLLHTAEYDPLRDEGRDFAEALRRADVPVELTCHPGMIHHFLGLQTLLPPAAAALTAIGRQARAAFGP